MGFSKLKASWLLSIMAIASVISRLTFGKLADLPKVNRLLMFQVCLGMMAVSTILCPFVATDYVGFAFYMAIFGMGDGCMVGTAPTLTAHIVGKSRISPAIGLLFFTFAGPLTVGPSFAGMKKNSSLYHDILQTSTRVSIVFSSRWFSALDGFLSMHVFFEIKEI